MKRITMCLAALALAVSLAGAASAHPCSPRVDRREFRQHERIRAGVRSGALGRREARWLYRGERRIHRMEWRAKADGRLSMRERVRLNRAQGRESRAIWRHKHNGRRI